MDFRDVSQIGHFRVMVREHRRGERRDLRKPCGRPIQRTPRHGRGFYPVFFIGRFRESGQQRSNDVDPIRIVEPLAITWIRAAL
jgi:hypothetical protein